MLPNQNLNLMKLYASIHGVCGLAEGYSDTTTRFFKTPDEALEHKSRLLDILTQDPHEKVVSQADGMEDIIIFNDDEGEHQILKIVEVNPLWDTEPKSRYTREWLMWNQMESEPVLDGEYLPTDMGAVKYALEAISDSQRSDLGLVFDLDSFQSFFNDLWYNKASMLDGDDVCIHFFRIPKSDTL